MSEKIFKNRITQETPNTIKQLKSLWIDMNSDKQLTPNTPNGLFAFTINPNNFVDAVKLETDFKSILSHYYHWRYGSKWRNLKHIQVPFQGIIEKQSNGINHIHILNRVDSAKALKKKLNTHPIFKDYHVVLAAGDGKINEDEFIETQKSYNKVLEAIKSCDKTITLSVGQLTTGITIPEWTAVLMLSNVNSPSLYMQAAFRAQNPCLFHYGQQQFRKENAYVFDFDPARTLVIFEQFANDLSSTTSAGKGSIDERKQHIRELINFFPVYGEDDDGEMIVEIFMI